MDRYSRATRALPSVSRRLIIYSAWDYFKLSSLNLHFGVQRTQTPLLLTFATCVFKPTAYNDGNITVYYASRQGLHAFYDTDRASAQNSLLLEFRGLRQLEGFCSWVL